VDNTVSGLVRSAGRGVDGSVGKKLPQEIVVDEVNNNTYVYTDAMELVEDMRRLRRKTGWTASFSHLSGQSFHFELVEQRAEDVDKEKFAHFRIPVRAVYQTLWPSLYGNDPDVSRLRQWFFARTGPDKVAAYVNEIPQETPLEGSSAMSRLLGDDELV